MRRRWRIHGAPVDARPDTRRADPSGLRDEAPRTGCRIDRKRIRKAAWRIPSIMPDAPQSASDTDPLSVAPSAGQGPTWVWSPSFLPDCYAWPLEFFDESRHHRCARCIPPFALGSARSPSSVAKTALPRAGRALGYPGDTTALHPVPPWAMLSSCAVPSAIVPLPDNGRPTVCKGDPELIDSWRREIAPVCLRCHRLLLDAGADGRLVKRTGRRGSPVTMPGASAQRLWAGRANLNRSFTNVKTSLTQLFTERAEDGLHEGGI
jgi:hypothetical protein